MSDDRIGARLQHVLDLVREHRWRNQHVDIRGDLLIESSGDRTLDMGDELLKAQRERSDVRNQIAQATERLGDELEAIGVDASVIYQMHEHCRMPIAMKSDWEGWLIWLRRTMASFDVQQVPELAVDVSSCTVLHEGTTHAVSPDAATLLHAICDAKGEWVVASKYTSTPSRVVKLLPEPLRYLIESAPGKGYRLR